MCLIKKSGKFWKKFFIDSIICFIKQYFKFQKSKFVNKHKILVRAFSVSLPDVYMYIIYYIMSIVRECG